MNRYRYTNPVKFWLLVGLAGFVALITASGIASALSPARVAPKASTSTSAPVIVRAPPTPAPKVTHTAPARKVTHTAPPPSPKVTHSAPVQAPTAPVSAGSLMAKIPGCSQAQSWGGDSLDGTDSNGACWLDGSTVQVKVLTWPAGDIADQASYANSGSLIAPGPCTITGTNPVPWVASAQLSTYSPAYAASVQQVITSSLGGTSMGGAACAGTSLTS